MTWRSGRCRALDTSRFDILMAGRMCICTAINHRFSVEKNEKIVRLWLVFLYFFSFVRNYYLKCRWNDTKSTSGVFVSSTDFGPRGHFLLVKALKVYNMFRKLFAWWRWRGSRTSYNLSELLCTSSILAKCSMAGYYQPTISTVFTGLHMATLKTLRLLYRYINSPSNLWY